MHNPIRRAVQLLCVIGALHIGCAASPEDSQLFNPSAGQLDGVPVEAVQSYVNPKRFALNVGGGLYPLDPYSLAFSMDFGIHMYFSRLWAWEIVQGSYAFNVEKGLRARIAEQGVTPTQLNLLEYAVSSNLVFIPYYGKSVFLGKTIQYSRTAILIGPGLIKTSLATNLGLSLGARFETYLNQALSYRIEVRDSIESSEGKHFLSVSLGVGAYF